MKKAVLLTFVLLVSSVSPFLGSVKSVEASVTICIRTDGNIEPSTANITSLDYVTYVFTGNNYDEIVVERSNITFDGNSYTVQGSGGGCGFNLTNVCNVTIKNTMFFLLGLVAGLVMNIFFLLRF